jgi:hypothetical protein
LKEYVGLVEESDLQSLTKILLDPASKLYMEENGKHLLSIMDADKILTAAENWRTGEITDNLIRNSL